MVTSRWSSVSVPYSSLMVHTDTDVYQLSKFPMDFSANFKQNIEKSKNFKKISLENHMKI